MKKLTSGNEAVAEAAIQAGCRFYAGYPITPQNEIGEYMARRMPDVGGVFIQSESEVAAVNMVFGAVVSGSRAMTSSSSPGISLKQEGISYLAACRLPAVIVNMMRGGPGLGDIRPSQSDYFQAVKGGGHGDYHLIVFAPQDVQEAYDMTFNAFNYADYYRNPVMILGDGILGQMMEPFEQKPVTFPYQLPVKDYVLNGCRGREPREVKSLFLKEGMLEKHNDVLQLQYARIKKELSQCEIVNVNDAQVVLVAYGTMGRICRTAIEEAQKLGIKVGMIRPQTVWPFPEREIAAVLPKIKRLLVVEMSAGQMVEDVRLTVNGAVPVSFFGKTGGATPTVEELMGEIKGMVAR